MLKKKRKLSLAPAPEPPMHPPEVNSGNNSSGLSWLALHCASKICTTVGLPGAVAVAFTGLHKIPGRTFCSLRVQNAVNDLDWI